jgi:nucleoside-diphosphate-sugar epimerase
MKLTNKRILVTGGTGFIGSRLVEILMLDHQAKVRVLVRNFSRASRIARFAEVQMAAGDISDYDAVDRAMENCDIVFHCAYDFSGQPQQRQQVNANGTENVAKAALKHGTRMVHISTIDVYGWPSEGKLDETCSRQAEGNIYAETKLEGEAIALDYHQKHGLPVTVLQPTIVYGPFSRPWTINPVKQLSSGQVVLVDEGQGCCNTVYVDDVVQAMVLAATKDEAIGEVFLISGEPVTWSEFYGTYEKNLGYTSTVSMPAAELEQRLKSDSTVKSSSAMALKPVATLPQPRLVFMLQNTDVGDRIIYVPLVHKFYNFLQALPKPLWRLLKFNVIKPTSEPNKQPPKPAPSKNNKKKPAPTSATLTGEPAIYFPDAWKLKLYRSKVEVQTDKAERLLGYKPKVSFEQGMKMTQKYLEWADLV